mgnify:CR=1 FL=1
MHVPDGFLDLPTSLATAAVARIRDWLDTPTVMVPDIFATRTVEALGRRLLGREPGGDRTSEDGRSQQRQLDVGQHGPRTPTRNAIGSR